MSFNSNPTPGTSGQTAAYTYSSIASFLENSLANLAALQAAMEANIQAMAGSATAIKNALISEANGMFSSAMGGLVGGGIACLGAAVSCIQTGRSFYASAKSKIGEAEAFAKRMDNAINGKEEQVVAEGARPPAGAPAVRGAGEVADVAVELRPVDAADAAKQKETFKERFKKLDEDERYNLDNYKDCDNLSIDDAKELLSLARERAHKLAEQLRAKKKDLNAIGQRAGEVSSATSTASQGLGQWQQSVNKTEQATHESEKQLLQSLSQQFQSMVEAYQKALQTNLDQIRALQDQAATGSQRASS